MNNKVESILNNSLLVEHVVFYAGMKGLIRNARHFVDPTSHQTPDLQLAYFETMCEGALEDLKLALKQQEILDPKDDAFEATLREVIGRLEEELGMQQMITRARAILKELDAPDPSDLLPAAPFNPEPEMTACPRCNRTRIPLSRDDFPEALLEVKNVFGQHMDLAWFCVTCRVMEF